MQGEIKEKHYDVLVVVGGCARICAAIAAARQGKRTLLIEKQILLGGIATLGRIHWLEPYYDSRGKQIIGGLRRNSLTASSPVVTITFLRHGHRAKADWLAVSPSKPSYLSSRHGALILSGRSPL